MGKQTKISGSNFGGQWTKEKLTIIKDYLNFYVTALSKQKVKLIYIDAFAGSGKTVLSNGEEVDGSAIISLYYNFDEYYFLEIDPDRVSSLKDIISKQFPDKIEKIHIINDDCNNCLISILNELTVYQRGVMFLDPYALELDWSVLDAASHTNILDIWYLFPVNALVRNMPKGRKLTDAASKRIDCILGTHDWEAALYKEDLQMSMFETVNYERVDFNGLVNYVTDRLKSSFAYVSPKSRILRNSKNSPLFILYFIMTNNSPNAISLGSRVVNQIFERVNSITIGIEDENNRKTNSFI